MRPGFRHTLETYGEIAKDEKGLNDRKEEAEESVTPAEEEEATGRLQNVLDWHLEKRAEKSGTTKEVQSEIFDIQRQKQDIMKRLKEDMGALDHPERPERGPSADARRVFERDGQMLWRREDGREVPLTMGEITTDLVWGQDYHLDKETVPRRLRKRLLLERAKNELQHLLDLQIMTEEIASSQTHPDRVKAYAAARERLESGDLPYGVAAEKMMVQLFRKQEIDREMPFQVIGADVYQDVTQKIDFIVRRTDHSRGVHIEDGGEQLKNKGIQFTLNTQRYVLNRKMDQIRRSKERLTEEDRIDDIMLVTMDIRSMGEAYRQWQEKGRPPGGPDKFLAPSVRKQIFTKTLEGMFPEEELQKMEF